MTHLSYAGATHKGLALKLAQISGVNPAAFERDLRQLGSTRHESRPHKVFVHAGETGLSILEKGYAFSYSSQSAGGRHIYRMYRPGDAIGFPHAWSGDQPYSICAITNVSVHKVSVGDLNRQLPKSPILLRGLLLDADIEQRAVDIRSALIARAKPVARLSHLLLETLDRIRLTSSYHNGQVASAELFKLHGTQAVIGDLTGMSPVHVSRTLTRLVNDGLIERPARKMYKILDEKALMELCEYQNPYTVLDAAPVDRRYGDAFMNSMPGVSRSKTAFARLEAL